MKVVYHESFCQCYADDAAAVEGRIESILAAIGNRFEFIRPDPASEEQILTVHTPEMIERAQRKGLYHIAALAAGGAITAARIGRTEPAFALIRPPGHHASRDIAWGYCYFNNMAIALTALKREGVIQTALVPDIDLHFGDGTVNILEDKPWATVVNPNNKGTRESYLDEISQILSKTEVDIIGVSAGFDLHKNDWGGLLLTEDYQEIGRLVRDASIRSGAGRFAVLEGGYNQEVLGQNVAAFLRGIVSGIGTEPPFGARIEPSPRNRS